MTIPPSLIKLLSAFDCYIRESSKQKAAAGNMGCYDFSKSEDLTIYLLWLIRHVFIHNGGIVDEKCKRLYERVIKQANDSNVRPLINLPMIIPMSYTMQITQDVYRKIKKASFKYIKEKLPNEQAELLERRSTLADLKARFEMAVDFGSFSLRFDLIEALLNGVTYNRTNKNVYIPEGSKYDFNQEKVVLPSGKTFRAKYFSLKSTI